MATAPPVPSPQQAQQAPPPPQAGAGQGAGAGAGAAAAGNASKAIVEEFRQLAMQLQMLAQKYPEATDTIAQMLPMLQKAMVQVIGNPARTPDQQAPPVGQ